MKSLIEKQVCSPGYTIPSALAMHKKTHVISKLKPRIRIIHIFAPEIIKINAENFREVVQRLTGKPAEDMAKKSDERMDVGGCLRIKGEEEIDGLIQDIFNQFPIVEEY